MAGLGGKREGAGRKSKRDERLIADVVNKCWERISRNLNGKRLTEEQKDLIALEIVKRTAPNKIDLKGNLSITGNKIAFNDYGKESEAEGE